MNKISDIPERNKVLEFLSHSATYGNLGAFIGAGFSKAVLNDDFDDIALSWGELLEKVSEELEVNYADICRYMERRCGIP